MINNKDLTFFSRLSRFQRLLSRALTNRLDAHNVTPGYLDILFRLWEEDKLSQKELRGRLDIEQATLSNTLARMERDNLVKRVQNPQDRRSITIELTEQGRGLQRVVTAALEDLAATINVGLTINDRRYFNRILQQMTEHLETDLDDQTLVLIDAIAD